MSAEPFRLDGHPGAPLSFTFNARALVGRQGDTVAAALLANGVHLVGRSFKYHRPRGIVAAGIEEPNAIVAVGRGARLDTNSQATRVELSDGLEALSPPESRSPTLLSRSAVARVWTPTVRPRVSSSVTDSRRAA